MASKVSPGELAQAFEANPKVRRDARENGRLTKWKDSKMIGIASTQAMAYNTTILENLAAWWTSQVDKPQAVPIDLIRTEAGVITNY